MELTELEKHEEITSVSFDHENAHLAVTHTLQGGAASGWNTSLILKTEDLDEELIKALDQVKVTMSHEDFLRKFFGLWHDDAELLTSILGFETEREYRNRLEASGEVIPDRWDFENETFDEFRDREIANEAERIELVKSFGTENLESLETDQKITLLKFQSEFEQHLDQLEEIEKSLKSKSEKATSDKEKNLPEEDNGVEDVTKAEGKSEEVSSAEGGVEEKTNIQKGKTYSMSDLTELLKSEEGQGLIKSLVADQTAEIEKKAVIAQGELEKAQTQIEELSKAKESKELGELTEVIKGYSFIGEDSHDSVTEALFKSRKEDSFEVVLSLLEKAQEAINAVGAEVGVEVEVEVAIDKANSNVAEILKARKENRSSK